MKRFLFPLMVSIALAFACKAPESPVDKTPSGQSDPSGNPGTSQDPGPAVTDSEDPTPATDDKVVLNGKDGFESFAAALQAAKAAGGEATIKLAKGTL